MKKAQVKLNEEKLKQWVSPSISLLKPENKYNIQVGNTIMSEDEFESYFSEYYKK